MRRVRSKEADELIALLDEVYLLGRELHLMSRRATAPIRSSRALMAQRHEPPVSLDNFPTPPWATRALCEVVLPHVGITVSDLALLTVWEPACGEGCMSRVLKEYFRKVRATDIHDYGGNAIFNFLCDRDRRSQVDWIITNPPFSGRQKRDEPRIDRSLEFILRAFPRARRGVAMFVRSQWAIEGIGRYERLFRQRGPTVIAPFAERVPLARGRWNPDGSTATAYCWLVWVYDAKYWNRLFRIPPGQRKALTMPTDRRRFAAWSMPGTSPLAEAAE